ncbi:MAG: hypothetical protein RIS60_748 [Pseudomonadota bacterium]
MNLRTLFLLIAFTMGQPAMAIEEPAFKIVLKAEAFEVRQYAPFLIAETVVEGDMDEASNKGFRKIADYIFGNNRAVQTGNAGKIAMTFEYRWHRYQQGQSMACSLCDALAVHVKHYSATQQPRCQTEGSAG